MRREIQELKDNDKRYNVQKMKKRERNRKKYLK